MPSKPPVELLPYTHSPVTTLWPIWHASKPSGAIPLLDIPAAEKLFKDLYTQEVPVIEHLSFTFLLRDVSVSFREQMVRHRVGVKVGDRLGCDMVPDLSESSWWSQSMRILSMERFATDGHFRMAPSIMESGAMGVLNQAMANAQDAYTQLVAMGVPMEDARDVVPIGATHDIVWTLNLRAMKHTIGKRSCWILQAGLWHDVITGMVAELVDKVSPLFAVLACPPCVDVRSDQFQSCVFEHENERRAAGMDKLPVCPLWLTGKGPAVRLNLPENMFKTMSVRAEQYRAFWGHNPYTWSK